MLNCRNGDEEAHFQTVSPRKEFVLLHLVVHTKSDISSCVKTEKESLREKFKSLPLSHLSTPGQSLYEVDAFVWLLVLESCKIVG